MQSNFSERLVFYSPAFRRARHPSVGTFLREEAVHISTELLGAVARGRCLPKKLLPASTILPKLDALNFQHNLVIDPVVRSQLDGNLKYGIYGKTPSPMVLE